MTKKKTCPHQYKFIHILKQCLKLLNSLLSVLKWLKITEINLMICICYNKFWEEISQLPGCQVTLNLVLKTLWQSSNDKRKILTFKYSYLFDGCSFFFFLMCVNLPTPCPPAAALLQVLSTWLPISAPHTSLDECFLFISLVVGLPYRLIFCHFWSFFVFKFVVIILLVVRGGTVCLPVPPSWPEVQILLYT